MSDADVIVLGGGPAGVAAAMSAWGCGLSVILIDEQEQAGGQVYRALPDAFTGDRAALGPDQREGDRLRRDVSQSKIAARFGRQAWSVAPGFVVQAIAGETLERYEAPRLIVATGASERIVPMPGWTLPGVIGLAAATILIKSQRMLPGARTVVAGAGPLLAAVAVGIVKGGGSVAAVVDLSARREWLGAARAMLARPDLALRGAGWITALVRAGVPILSGHGVTAIEGAQSVEAVQIAPVDASGRSIAGATPQRIACDSVALGHGLVPSTDVTRLLRAEHVFDPAAGGWIARSDDWGRTSIPGLYVAGDGARIAGAAAAAIRGRIAGRAAAIDAGKASTAPQLPPGTRERRLDPRAGLAPALRFGAAMAQLMRPRQAMIADVPRDCIVCRCEDVTRGEIEEALDAGARDVNQLKSWTRCGMGPCQGRICGEAAAMLVASRTGSRESAGQFTGRSPLRPLPYAAVTGEFDYSELNLPVPAPS
jgi:thioredoxin reductase/bacterioferritin-associated ferredoxin